MGQNCNCKYLIYHNFLFPRQIYFNVVVADMKALATSATTHIFSSCKLTIPTSIIFLQIYVIFSILSVKWIVQIKNWIELNWARQNMFGLSKVLLKYTTRKSETLLIKLANAFLLWTTFLLTCCSLFSLIFLFLYCFADHPPACVNNFKIRTQSTKPESNTNSLFFLFIHVRKRTNIKH